MPMQKNISPSVPDGHLSLAVVPHPFAVERVQDFIPAGESITDILAAHTPMDAVLCAHAHVYIDGAYIPQDRWHCTKPKAGTILSLRIVPRGGGGGKNPLRTILSLALVAASPMLVAGITGALGATAQATFLGISAGRIITAGVNLLGRLALNALAPPGKPRFGTGLQESPTLFIQGARNQAYPFARVPKILGKHRFVPPLGALPYTETVGNEQYIRMLFVWGYGPLQITDIKIGETPITEFDGVDIETRQGYPDDAPLTLYSNSVMQTDMDVTLRESDGYVTRSTETEADEISVDITLPRGLLVFNGNGGKSAASVHLEVQYSPAGANDWSASGTSYKSIAAQNITLPPRPAGYRKSGHSSTVHRIDRVFLDTASGRIFSVSSPAKRLGVAGEEPEIPAVPGGAVALARVLRKSSDGSSIDAGRITDERSADTIARYFENDTDFVVGAGSGNTLAVAAGGLTFPGIYLTAKQSSALRHSVRFTVPRGKYDVRIRRITADAVDDNTFNDTVWTALRSLRHSYPVRMQNLAVTALRIKATDQMSGIVDRLNGVVHSILPDWDGEEWVEQVTSNPAALYRHVLQGSANARPLGDARIDLARLQNWHDACTAAGYEFNAVIDYDVSVREVLQDIAATGRASPTILDGKWSVIEDKPQSVPIQHFTPYNTFGFQGRKAFEDVPEALRIRFINRDKGWMQDERLVFQDGMDETTATKYESLTLTGITDAAQAWRAGRYHLATAQLRPETYSFHCDIEHIVCTRGDLIRFTHDVPLFGLHSSRIAALLPDATNPDLVAGAVLESVVEMAEGQSYAVRFRTADGSALVLPLVTVAGAAREIYFAIPQPAAGFAQEGDLALVGIAGRESVALVVKSIEPQSDLSARITCVDAAPEIHMADQGIIPAFTSQMTLPADMQRPPRPVLSAVQAGGDVLIRHADGSTTNQMVITLQPPAYSGFLDVQVMIRAQDETYYREAAVLGKSVTRIAITDISENDIYDIRLRYVSASGIFSAALVIPTYRHDSGGNLPPDVANLRLNTIRNTAYLTWDRLQSANLRHFKLRFYPDTSGASWAAASDMAGYIPPDSTSVPVPARIGTYMIKAVSQSGRESAIAASVITDVAALDGYNAVTTIDEGPAFEGSVANVIVEDNQVMLAEGYQSGYYYFVNSVDLGSSFTSLVTATVDAAGLDRAASLDNWPDIDRIENIDDNAAPGLWQVQLQTKTTSDPLLLPPSSLIDHGSDLTHADWTKTRSTVNANVITAPDGSVTADKLVENTAGSTHMVSQLSSAAENAATGFTIYAKAAGRDHIGIFLSTSATSVSDGIGGFIDLTDGTTSSLYTFGTGEGITLASDNLGDGWWRISIVGRVNPSGTTTPVYAQIRLAVSLGSTSYTGDGSSGVYIWGAHVTNGSLPYAPAWTPWKPFTMGEYTARAFQFRALLTSEMENVTPVISALSVSVDMPDRTESGKAIVSDPAGSTIPFAQGFHAPPAVAITAQNMATGDYYTITNIAADGFDIRFFNSGGTGISRNFDYVAKGYGATA